MSKRRVWGMTDLYSRFVFRDKIRQTIYHHPSHFSMAGNSSIINLNPHPRPLLADFIGYAKVA